MTYVGNPLSLSAVGEDVATLAVDSAAVFLYTLFSSDLRWNREHANKIRKTLGPFPASAANRACESVKKIVSLCPQSKEDGSTNSSDTASEKDDAILQKEFGHNIVFKSPQSLLESAVVGEGKAHGSGAADPSRSEAACDSLSEDEAPETDAFSRAILNGMASKQNHTAARGADESDRVKSKPSGAGGSGDVALYSGEWLAQQLQACCREGCSMSWHDLYMAVFELLSSTHDNTAIQNDVRHL